MKIQLMIGKLHQASVTQCDLHYQGSLTIDRDLLRRAGLYPHQKIDVYNINTGARFSTYTLEGEAGSRVIGVNGAAARMCQKGDRIIIVGFGEFEPHEAETHVPKVLVLDENNGVVSEGH